jgi:hypothetical protein
MIFVERAIGMIKSYVEANKYNVKGVMLFGSRKAKSDLDYLMVLGDDASFFRIEDLTNEIFKATGVFSDVSCMKEKEVRDAMSNDFMLHDIIQHGESIYNPGLFEDIRKIKIDPEEAYKEMMLHRQNQLVALKKSVLENLSVTLSTGYYDFLFRKTGKVVDNGDMDSLLCGYGIDSSLRMGVKKILKEGAKASFSEIETLEGQVRSELINLKNKLRSLP